MERPSVATIQKTSKSPRRTLRGGRKQASRQPRRRFIRSWAGRLELRDRLRALASRVLEADAAAAFSAKAHGWSSTGAICAAIRDPALVPSPEVAEAAHLFRELRDLQSELFWTHNLDGNLVVTEATMVLDSANASRHQKRVSDLLRQPDPADLP